MYTSGTRNVECRYGSVGLWNLIGRTCVLNMADSMICESSRRAHSATLFVGQAHDCGARLLFRWIFIRFTLARDRLQHGLEESRRQRSKIEHTVNIGQLMSLAEAFCKFLLKTCRSCSLHLRTSCCSSFSSILFSTLSIETHSCPNCFPVAGSKASTCSVGRVCVAAQETTHSEVARSKPSRRLSIESRHR